MKNLEVTFTAPVQDTLMIELSGAFTSMEALEFKSQMGRTINILQKDCYVDLSNVQDFDLSALNTLVRMHRSLAKLGRKMTINTGKLVKVKQLMSLTQMDQVLAIRA